MSLIEKIEAGKLVYSPARHKHVRPEQRRTEEDQGAGVREHRMYE